jgi:hypothetical protein
LRFDSRENAVAVAELPLGGAEERRDVTDTGRRATRPAIYFEKITRH